MAITPILVTPYIAIKLGPDVYSRYAVALNIISLCAALSDFGIQQRATEVYSSARRTKSQLADFHVDALSLRLIIAILASFAAILYMNSIDFNNTFNLLLTVICIIFQGLTPLWIYFGSGRYNYLLKLITGSRVFFAIVVLIALYITPSDTSALVVFCGMHAIVCIGALFGSAKEIGSYSQASIRGALKIFHQSLDYFFSRTAVLLSNFAPIFLLSFDSNTRSVAFFSIAQLIYFSCQAIVAPFGQFLLNEMYHSYRPRLVFWATCFSLIAALIQLILFVIIGRDFIEWIFGHEFGASYSIAVPLAVAFVFHAPSVFLGFPLLAPAGRANIANRSTVVAILVATAFSAVAYTQGLPLPVFLPWSIVIFEACAFLIRCAAAFFLTRSLSNRNA